MSSAVSDLFGVHHLPYGVFTTGGGEPRIGTRVGDRILDLAACEAAGLVEAAGTLGAPVLNPFMSAGRPLWTSVRHRLQEILTIGRYEAQLAPFFVPLPSARLQLPFTVADYVDFYSSEYHASNVGQMLRPGQSPLLPNWRHLPVGYHGRAGTVVVSGTDVVRPCGQRKPAGAEAPVFGPSRRLDIEAELGFVVGTPTALGTRVPTSAFADHVFGAVLVNDWSARDIQGWEYQPLGPFLAKSFATSISAWVTPLDALDSARVPLAEQDPPVLPYLIEEQRSGYDVAMSVTWNGTVVSRPPARLLYWTAAQQLAHLTVNGAALRTGDLFASGTVSGPERDQTGSFLELTWGGSQPLRLADGSSRTFLEDGDTVTISATAPGPDGSLVGFGDVTGRVIPPLA